MKKDYRTQHQCRIIPSLQALSTAALVLPGLFQPAAQAEDGDSVDFQYSHYQEGKRDIYASEYNIEKQVNEYKKVSPIFKPIEVDSLHGSSRITLTDRIKFAFNYTQDTWSGATPIGTAPVVAKGNRVLPITGGASPWAAQTNQFYIDGKGNTYDGAVDPNTGLIKRGKILNKLTHVLAAASPETRKQGDFKLSYAWDEAALDIGGGISVENDYESRFVNIGGQMDFNQKRTTLNAGLSYTNSDTFATLDPDSLSFIDAEGYTDEVATEIPGVGNRILHIPLLDAPAHIVSTYSEDYTQTGATLYGKRQDWGLNLGLTQLINKNAALTAGMAYTRSTGYLANPYKVVYVFDALVNTLKDLDKPVQVVQGNTGTDGAPATLEKRPEERNQFQWNLGFNQYIEPFDAALHVNYRFTHDDWGIRSHTFEGDWVQSLGAGWTVTPRFRYYSQSAADFYTPFLVRYVSNTTGNVIKGIPEFYSSDHRLADFGALSGGVTVSKQLAKGVAIEAGFEYYTHQANLGLGNKQRQAFDDFDFWSANAALKVDFAALNPGGHSSHDSGHALHQHSLAPAGIMFDHTLAAGDVMLGYRYMRGEQAGNVLLGSDIANLETMQLEGCGDVPCLVSPKRMTMNMHMLELMYAPADWLTLMLMPQWQDMDMTMNPLPGQTIATHNHASGLHAHQTGGVGDTGLYALFKLYGDDRHHVTLGVGGTAPSGDAEIKQRKNSTTGSKFVSNIPIHYGMQLGSGTWDFKPSLTYTGNEDRFQWGAQATGTLRLDHVNNSGFAFGDIFQGSVWGGYQWTDWLSSTVRGVYTWQGEIDGRYPGIYFTNNDEIIQFVPTHVGPFDRPENYGGQFWDLGLGLNVTIPHGTFAGNSIKFEWLQPLHTDYNSYQLDRDYSLNFTWSYGF